MPATHLWWLRVTFRHSWIDIIYDILATSSQYHTFLGAKQCAQQNSRIRAAAGLRRAAGAREGDSEVTKPFCNLTVSFPSASSEPQPANWHARWLVSLCPAPGLQQQRGASERRDSALLLRLVALATPRSLCSSPQPSLAPRTFRAPASCGQGPKRPPRPASGLPAGCLPPQRCVLLELCLAASGRPYLLARCGCNSRSDQSTVYGW